MYDVRVKQDHRWPTVRVSGREFSKAGEVLGESHLNDEIRSSPLLEIEEIVQDQPSDVVDATNAARDLAAEHDIDLAAVDGSGEEGRVLKADVQAVIEEGAGDPN
jgi:pyruvate/2-oxoglutarate dehydrogenase complex dihydrolipoamide acyltransferase (E2) component